MVHVIVVHDIIAVVRLAIHKLFGVSLYGLLFVEKHWEVGQDHVGICLSGLKAENHYEFNQAIKCAAWEK